MTSRKYHQVSLTHIGCWSKLYWNKQNPSAKLREKHLGTVEPHYYVPRDYDQNVWPVKTPIEIMYNVFKDNMFPQSTFTLVFMSYIHGTKKKRTRKYVLDGSVGEYI